jgi:hypothetical protein
MIAMVLSGEPLAVSQWETFYVIVGSAGGALTGLLFVVVALVADRLQVSAAERGLSVFTTPSMFHFINVLAMSALITMPRTGLGSLALLLAVVALIGLAVTVITVMGIFRFDAYKAVAEDWTWHGVIPGAAYLSLLGAAIELRSRTDLALYTAGGVALALLFTGIHNAWDVAIYSTINMPKNSERPRSKPDAKVE